MIKKGRLCQLPRYAMTYLLAVELIAVAIGIWSLISAEWHLSQLEGLSWITVSAILTIEASRRIDRLRINERDRVFKELYSIWLIAVLLLFPLGSVVLFTLILYLWIFLRVKRSSIYRSIYSASTMVIGLALGNMVYRAFHPGSFGVLHGSPKVGLAVVLAALVAMAVNIILIAFAIRLSRPNSTIAQAFGRFADYGIEGAIVAVGIFIAAAFSITHWLVVLGVPTLFVLQRALLLAQFQTAARTDSKTGLANATWWRELAVREIDRAQRFGEQVTILLADLDHFKDVNDTYGHLAGDAVLRRVAKAFTSEVREYDAVGRFGGEEFVVLLPATGSERAARVAERLRNRISELVVDITDAQGIPRRLDNLTVSIGVATFPEAGHEVSELIRLADAALYTAKLGGRNRVSAGDDPASSSPHQRA